MSKKIVRFRVYPESIHGYYFEVAVYATCEAMQRAARRAHPGQITGFFDDAEAAVIAFRSGTTNEKRRTVWKRTLGKIVFHRGMAGMNIISHECTHAALRWMEQMNFNALDRSCPNYVAGAASDNEERFCHAVGRLAAQIGNKLWETGVYK